MSHRPLLLALLGSLVFAPVLAGGCPPCFSESQILDDFEGDCAEDFPCGWTVTRGSVERVTTFHESQHGMSLAPDTRADIRFSYASRFAPLSVYVVTRCDEDTTLRVRLRGSSPDVDGSVGEPVEQSADVETSDPALYERFDEPLSWPLGATPDALSLETIGAGSCTVDEVILVSTVTC